MRKWFPSNFMFGKPELTESQAQAMRHLEQVLDHAILYWIHNPDGSESNPLSQLVYILTTVAGSKKEFLNKTVRHGQEIRLAFYNAYALKWGFKSSWILGQEPLIWVELSGRGRDQFPQLTMLIDDYLRQSDLLKK